jgi:hypothetical protein
VFVLIVTLFFIWFVIVNKQEKRLLLDILPQRIAIYARKYIV